MSANARVVVVAEDRPLARSLVEHLGQAGYAVRSVSGSVELRRLLRSEAADLVLLDLDLGAEDGIDLVRDLVRTTTAAVIIVTGRDALQDRLTGLDSGADDYVVTPFEPAELLARVRAALRRQMPEALPEQETRVGPFSLVPASQILRRDGCALAVHLTETETRLMGTLMQHYNRAVTRTQLLGKGVAGVDDRIAAVHIANVRRKLREAGIGDLVIWPVRGFGYRMRIEPEVEGGRKD